MRLLMIVAALAALSACNRGGGTNNGMSRENKAADNGAAPAAAGDNAQNASANAAGNSAANGMAAAYPSDFPGSDPAANAADCYVFLSFSMQDANNGTGATMEQLGAARTAWRASLRRTMTEDETTQLTASNVNPRLETPAPQRDAASRWCVEHAPAGG